MPNAKCFEMMHNYLKPCLVDQIHTFYEHQWLRGKGRDHCRPDGTARAKRRMIAIPQTYTWHRNKFLHLHMLHMGYAKLLQI